MIRPNFVLTWNTSNSLIILKLVSSAEIRKIKINAIIIYFQEVLLTVWMKIHLHALVPVISLKLLFIKNRKLLLENALYVIS
jgi:hypothetical protein